MKKTASSLLLFACLGLTACDSGPFASAASLKSQVDQNLQQRNFAIAAEKALALTVKTPDSADAFFLLAQAQAQLGQHSAAIASLDTAIRKGFKDDRAIESNPHLASLRTTAAYVELMATAFARAGVALGDTSQVSAAGDVGIVQTESKTVIRAGDVTVEMPKDD